MRRLGRYLSVARIVRGLEVILLVATIIYTLTGRREIYLNSLGARADALALLTIFISFGVLHIVAGHFLVPAIVRRFSPRPYDDRRILLDLSHAARAAVNVNQLYEIIVKMIGDALGTENVSIFVRDDETGDFVCRMCSDQEASEKEQHWTIGGPRVEEGSSQLVFKRGAFVIKRLRHLATPWSVGPLELETWMRALDAAPPAEREERARECATLEAIKARLLLQIKIKEQLVGVLSVGPRHSAHGFSEKDKELLMNVAGQLALVIENSKLIERMVEEESLRRELALAEEVQQRLFPPNPPVSDALELAGFCRPARQVGGDYYDFLNFDNEQLGIAIADVAGKGISAALLMSTVQASLRSQAMMNCADVRSTGSISELVASLNRLLCRSTGDSSYVTFFYAQFDERTRRLTYVNAGHNPPLLIRANAQGAFEHEATTAFLPLKRANGPRVIIPSIGADGEANGLGGPSVAPAKQNGERGHGYMRFTAGGPVIGLFESFSYREETLQMRSGDLLVAYTDGVTEALNTSGEEFGEERLRETLAAAADLSAEEIGRAIRRRIQEWSAGAPQHDDLTFVVLKVK